MTRRTQFFLFFSLFFLLYGIVNSYIFLRAWHSLPEASGLHLPFVVLFCFLSLSFIGGRFLERVTLSWVSKTLVWIGSFWLAALVYFYVAVMLIDVLRLANLLIPFFPEAIRKNPQQAAGNTALAVFGIVFLIVVFGALNARIPRIRRIDLTIAKNSQALKSINVVVASDIHLGTIIGKARLTSIVAAINSLEPDLVLLPGDVVDEDIGPVLRNNLGETLKSIRATYGIVAVTGNHEYIGGVEEACRYLSDHGILMLRDQTVKIAESLYVVGREDISKNRFTGTKRKSLQEIMNGIDRSFPILLMDHQPFRLDEAMTNGVDLQLSGHTHHGQLWPFSFITRSVYELSWGYKRKGETHFYVSCGVGTWGPSVRIGNRPEIVNFRISFRAAGEGVEA